MVCRCTLTHAHALEQHGTPTFAGRRAPGAALWRVAMPRKLNLGRFWRELGGEDGIQGLHIQLVLGRFSLTAAHSCGCHGTPGASGRRAHGATEMRVSVFKESRLGILEKIWVKEVGYNPSKCNLDSRKLFLSKPVLVLL